MAGTLTHNQILKLPKTDLHRHLDGALRPELLLKLAKQSGVRLPTRKLSELTRLYQIVEPRVMPIDQLFQRFAWSIAVMRTPYGLYQAAREQVHDLARENILYAEVRLAPGYHSIYHAPWYFPPAHEKDPFPVMSLDQVVWAALSGLGRGMEETGIAVNLTLCVPRESLSMWGPKSVSDIVKLAIRFQKQGVVSLDLACDEFSYPPGPYAEYFRSAIGSHIRRNPHAGEMGDDPTRLKNIAVCVEQLCANGLGHAIPLYQSKELMAVAKKRNIRVERTPLSPVQGCSLANGHLDELLAHGVPVVITSDDPVLMRATLTDNWVAALNYHGYGEKEFWQLTANALNTAFFRDRAQKNRVLQQFIRRGINRSLLKIG